MKKNNGKKFESIVNAIQSALQPTDTVVHKNIKAQGGKRGEIDILMINDSHVIAVECKNYIAPVSVVDAFYGKCQRLSRFVPNKKIDEIMVVANGFQSGAIEAAQFFKISLYNIEKTKGYRTPVIEMRFKIQSFENLIPSEFSGDNLFVDDLHGEIYRKMYTTLGRDIKFKEFIRDEGTKLLPKGMFCEKVISVGFDYKLSENIIITNNGQEMEIKSIHGRAILKYVLSPVSSKDSYQYKYNHISQKKEVEALLVSWGFCNTVYTFSEHPVLESNGKKSESKKMTGENGETYYIANLPEIPQTKKKK